MTQLNIDLEGPITLGDNAFELASEFLPQGDRLFTLISRYDDILALVAQRPGYRAGSTLKLILPFLLAFGMDRRAMEDLAKRNARFVPGAAEVVREIGKLMPVFIVSTSYEPYVQAVASSLGLPGEALYSTGVDLGRYRLDEAERKKVQELYAEVLALPPIEVPEGVSVLTDLPPETARAVVRLDRIFQEVSILRVGRVLREVEPRGGVGKAEAVLDSLKLTGGGLEDVIYIGDSITDVEALKLVRAHGGLAVAFNGNRYAIEAAELACISSNARPLGRIAEIFHGEGREGVLKLAGEGRLEGVTPISLPDEALIAASERMRIAMRGTAGALG